MCDTAGGAAAASWRGLVQDPLVRMAFRFARDNATGAEKWRKELADGSLAVALTNLGATARRLGFRVSDDLQFAPDTVVSVRDVLGRRDLGHFQGSFQSPKPVPSHGTALLRVSYAPPAAAAVGRGAEL